MARRYAIRLTLPNVDPRRRWLGRFGLYEPLTAVHHVAANVYPDEMAALAALPWATDMDPQARVVEYPHWSDDFRDNGEVTR